MKTKNILWGLLLVITAGSCIKKEDTAGGSLFSQQVLLYKVDGTTKKMAAFSDMTAVVGNEDEVDLKKNMSFFVGLAKENNENLSVTIAWDPQAAEKYNQVYGTQYLMMPDSLISFPTTLNVKANNILSEEGIIQAKISSSLKDNVKYIFALTAQAATQGVSILNASKTLIYTVEKSKGIIKKTVPITRDLYLQLEDNSSMAGIGTTFTMEGLLWVDKFRGPGDGGDAGISTFMGTEGATLMRFGDAGVDPDHLQANGVDIGVKFQLKKWYHIALVVDGSKTTAYVDGAKVIDFTKTGRLASFFIGRSYNDNRGLPGRVAEIRLWNKARTANEIQENIYTVDKKSPGLYAYWKMNEVKDNKIEDVSGNNRNLILMGQSALSGRQVIKLYDEDGIKVGE